MRAVCAPAVLATTGLSECRGRAAWGRAWLIIANTWVATASCWLGGGVLACGLGLWLGGGEAVTRGRVGWWSCPAVRAGLAGRCAPEGPAVLTVLRAAGLAAVAVSAEPSCDWPPLARPVGVAPVLLVR